MFIDKNIDEQTDIVANNMIEIPRITISRDTKRNYFFEDFNLDTTKFNYVPITGATLLQNLHTNESEERKDKGVVVMGDTPENTIVSLIIDHQDIDYDICSDLLFKLVGQALEKISQGYSEEEVKRIDMTDDPIVLQKASAALKFCSEATKYTAYMKKKPWKYLIVPTTKFDGTSSFDTLAKLYAIDKVESAE